MKILLIDPPFERLIGFKFEWFPYGLLSIASYLESKGENDIKVYGIEHNPGSDSRYLSVVKYSDNISSYKDICDSNTHPIWEEIRNRVILFNPDVVGISVLNPKTYSAFKIANIVKAINPNIKIVCGNQHPTTKPEDVLSNKNVDFVVRGEGELTFLELVQALKTPKPCFNNLKGLSFKDANKIIHNPDRDLIVDINILPKLNLDLLLDVETYSKDQLSMIMTSRGCPFQCGFCASSTIWKRKVRYRSIKNVLTEIEFLRHTYGIDSFTIMDDAFTIDKNRVVEFCNALINDKIRISWDCLTRVDIISEKLVHLMKKAGCRKVTIGIESGCDRILKLMNKGITKKQIEAAVGILRKQKMYWAGFFLCGIPTETEQEIKETVLFMKKLRPDWAYLSVFTPYPETELYDLCKKDGIIKSEIEYGKYTHQYPSLDFTGCITQKRGKELVSFILKEFHKYNKSPIKLIKRALNRNYPRNPQLIFHDVKKTLQWLKP